MLSRTLPVCLYWLQPPSDPFMHLTPMVTSSSDCNTHYLILKIVPVNRSVICVSLLLFARRGVSVQERLWLRGVSLRSIDRATPLNLTGSPMQSDNCWMFDWPKQSWLIPRVAPVSVLVSCERRMSHMTHMLTRRCVLHNDIRDSARPCWVMTKRDLYKCGSITIEHM